MDMALTLSDRRFGSAQEAAPDFPALVALLAAHQASLPVARLARRLGRRANHGPAALESLVRLFSGKIEPDARLAALRGSFNPAVPQSNAALTGMKGW